VHQRDDQESGRELKGPRAASELQRMLSEYSPSTPPSEAAGVMPRAHVHGVGVSSVTSNKPQASLVIHEHSIPDVVELCAQSQLSAPSEEWQVGEDLEGFDDQRSSLYESMKWFDGFASVEFEDADDFEAGITICSVGPAYDAAVCRV